MACIHLKYRTSKSPNGQKMLGEHKQIGNLNFDRKCQEKKEKINSDKQHTEDIADNL